MKKLTKEFVRLHGQLFLLGLLLDGILLVLAVAYLLIPISEFAVTSRNVMLGLVAVLALVALQVHFIKEGSGGPAFYLMLPISRKPVFIAAMGISLLPFVLAVGFTTGILCALSLLFKQIPPAPILLSKGGHVLTAVFFIKTLPLPSLVLSQKHPVMIVLFYFAIGLLGLFTFWCVPQAFSAVCHIPAIILVMIFLLLVGLAEMKAVNNSRL